MIRDGFLSEEDPHRVNALAGDGSAGCRVPRRVNALVLLEDGWSWRGVEGTEEGQLHSANIKSRRRTMLNSHTDNASQAMQEAAREGAGQASLIAQISTDVSERAARAGTEILQRHADTVQEALQLAPRSRRI